MWRSICVVVLLPCLAAAQVDSAANPPSPPQTAGPETKSSGPPSYSSHTYYTAIRQGTTEKAALDLVLGQRGKVFISARSRGGMVPLKLDLQSGDGLTVSHLDYPESFSGEFAFQKKHITVHAADFPIHFRLRAAQSAAPGLHLLRGKLTFQTIDDTGVAAVRQMDVQLPVTVVEANAPVARSAWPYYNPNPDGAWTYVALALFAPLVIPLMILMLLVCAGNCGS